MNKLDQLTRTKVIDILINNELEVNMTDPSMCREMLLTGCVGYKNMTDESLVNELNMCCDYEGELIAECKAQLAIDKLLTESN